MNPSRIVLSLARLREFDPHGGQGRGEEGRWLCPLCGEGKSRSDAHRCLSAKKSDGVWHCHRCHEGGVLQEFWKSFTASGEPAKNKNQEARLRRAHLSVLSEDMTPAPEEEPPENDAETYRTLWEASQDVALSRGVSYLEIRGVEAQVVASSLVRYSPAWLSAGRGAVLFPIQNREGKLVAVQGRYIDGQENKFDGAPLPKARTMGSLKEGVFRACCELNSRRLDPFDAASPAIIVTEAPIDALSLAVLGFPSVALCGTSIPHWFHLACGLKKVALATDADEAGDAAAAKHEAFLSVYGAQCFRLRPEDAKDWNEMLQKKGIHGLCDWVSLRLL